MLTLAQMVRQLAEQDITVSLSAQEQELLSSTTHTLIPLDAIPIIIMDIPEKHL